MEVNFIYGIRCVTGLIFALFLINSCVDFIDLSVDEVQEIIIIEGIVQNDGSSPVVRISKSAAFAAGPDGVEMPILGAKVEISEIGGETIQLVETDPGVYGINRSLGTSAKEYQLFVSFDGQSYVSLIEKMPPTIQIQELSWITKDEIVENISGNLETREIIEIRADADLSNVSDNVFLRYRINGIWEFRERFSLSNPLNLNPLFCYISGRVDLNNLALIDGREINNGQLVNQKILEEILDFRFAHNYCFAVTQQSISNNAFNYWNSIRNEFERTGDIFEAPPARIKGNIFNTISTKNDVIGIFTAIAPSTSNISVSGLGLDILGRCDGFGRDLPETCFQCETIINSSTVKPECL